MSAKVVLIFYFSEANHDRYKLQCIRVSQCMRYVRMRSPFACTPVAQVGVHVIIACMSLCVCVSVCVFSIVSEARREEEEEESVKLNVTTRSPYVDATAKL